MKKTILFITILALILALVTACGQTAQTQQSFAPTTDPTVETTAAQTEPESENEGEYEGDASSYYIDVVYAKQLDRYYTALSEKWNADAYATNAMSALAEGYYEGNPLDNVGFTFMDLDGDGIWELLIGAIQNAEEEPLLFEIWGLKNDAPVMIAQSSVHERYYLQYAQEDELWSVSCEVENGADKRAVYNLQLAEGVFQVVQGVVFDAAANQEKPWFMTYDLDLDTGNDMPVDEATANAVIKAGRNIYSAAEYFPYSLY